MDLLAAAKLEDIPVLENPPASDFASRIPKQRQAVIIKGAGESWPFVERWTLDYIAARVGSVRVQKPSGDGVYYFMGFKRIPFEAFCDSLTGPGDLYLSADPILGKGGKPVKGGDLVGLAPDLSIPRYLPERHIVRANLWIGAGENRSLLHYDPWDSFLVMVSGRKRVAIFPPDQTDNLYPYGVFDIGSLLKGQILDSKITPRSIQGEFVDRVQMTKGTYGEIERGDILFIPAGFWHYVQSFDLNIAVNYFTKVRSKRALVQSPLRAFLAKRWITAPPVQTVGRAARFGRRLYRRVVKDG